MLGIHVASRALQVGLVSMSVCTLTYQNLLFCRVPVNSILGCIIRTYGTCKKVGFGSLRYVCMHVWMDACTMYVGMYMRVCVCRARQLES